VDHLGDPPQNWIGEFVPVQDRLERAAASVVAELDPAHVEGRRILDGWT
jgi:hypothetical protein